VKINCQTWVDQYVTYQSVLQAEAFIDDLIHVKVEIVVEAISSSSMQRVRESERFRSASNWPRNTNWMLIEGNGKVAFYLYPGSTFLFLSTFVAFLSIIANCNSGLLQ
jgi:hypothetical protein